jgi:hypothetical protein
VEQGETTALVITLKVALPPLTNSPSQIPPKRCDFMKNRIPMPVEADVHNIAEVKPNSALSTNNLANDLNCARHRMRSVLKHGLVRIAENKFFSECDKISKIAEQ